MAGEAVNHPNPSVSNIVCYLYYVPPQVRVLYGLFAVYRRFIRSAFILKKYSIQGEGMHVKAEDPGGPSSLAARRKRKKSSHRRSSSEDKQVTRKKKRE